MTSGTPWRHCSHCPPNSGSPGSLTCCWPGWNRSGEPPRQILEAVRLIRARRGRVTVRWLAGQVNLSISQLERGFTRHVGVGPKLLARQTRVCALAAEATTPANPGRALLAAKYGYADQAHLAREFRELTGFTPSGLARVGSDADFLQDALACHRGVFKPAIA